MYSFVLRVFVWALAPFVRVVFAIFRVFCASFFHPPARKYPSSRFTLVLLVNICCRGTGRRVYADVYLYVCLPVYCCCCLLLLLLLLLFVAMRDRLVVQ